MSQVSDLFHAIVRVLAKLKKTAVQASASARRLPVKAEHRCSLAARKVSPGRR
ncbi:hypothetical protein IE4803_PD00440 (plasmid) [Rhizobium etli bv. phaseoli str. IE4803]|nr:hypothetical protein IE4803_PD00440 [Rhizobium etli bv. phaseoli str. IE4803]